MERAKREREGRKDDSKMPGGKMGGGRKRESRLSSLNNTRCTCTGPAPWHRVVDCMRLTEERWRKRGEESNERTTAKRPEARDVYRRKEIHPSRITNPGSNSTGTAPRPRVVDCRRLTEERWRKRGEESEERTTEGQGDGWGEQPSASSLRESDRTMEERRV